jgi:cytochrome c
MQRQNQRQIHRAKWILPVFMATVFGCGLAVDHVLAQDAKVSTTLTLPGADVKNGRKLYATKGCVGCHAMNGIGGTSGVPLDAATMDPTGNVFEFLARLWIGIDPMIDMQEKKMGQQIELSAQDWADIVAFIHDADEQKTFAAKEIPADIVKLMEDD